MQAESFHQFADNVLAISRASPIPANEQLLPLLKCRLYDGIRRLDHVHTNGNIRVTLNQAFQVCVHMLPLHSLQLTFMNALLRKQWLECMLSAILKPFAASVSNT